MSALDEIVGTTHVATRKALTPQASNVALHPATVPQVVRHGVLKHVPAGSPGPPNPPARVVAVLGPGATFTGLAAVLLPLYARAAQAGGPPPPDRDDLARALVVYAETFSPTLDFRDHRVGLCLPLPIEIDALGTWAVNADQVRSLSATFPPASRPRLTTPPTPLDVPEPARIESEANALLMAAGSPDVLGPRLRERMLRNPSDAVLTFYEIVRRLHDAGTDGPGQALTLVLATLDGAKVHQLSLLAAISAGNGILRRCRTALDATPPDGTDMGKLIVVRASVVDALFQGPAGARTLVPHREVPETVDLLGIRKGVAAAVRGAPVDPPGGQHRIVLGRDVAIGRTDTAKVDGTTFTGPAFAGRVPLDPFLEDDAKALQTADPLVTGWRVLRSLGHRTPDGLFDAARASDAGLLSAGLGAWSATDPAGLPALLFRFKDIAPAEFDLFFRLHGLDVDRHPTDATRFRLRKIAADGTSSTELQGAALRDFLGGRVDAPGAVTFSSDWAVRFRLAALVSRRFRRAQALLLLDRVQRSVDAVELAVASVDPFPAKPYELAFDPHRSSDLQGEVNLDAGAFLKAQQAAGVLSADTLSGAIIDLTGGPDRPAYASSHAADDEDTFYIASTAKTAALYAALELRLRLRQALEAAEDAGLDVAKATWRTKFTNAVVKTWSGRIARGFPGFDTSMPARFPKLGTIFALTTVPDPDDPAAPPIGHIDFTNGTDSDAQVIAHDVAPPKAPPHWRFLQLLKSMIYKSSDKSSAEVINAIGYPYLNGVLRDGGFFHPTSERGIWVSGNYTGNDWKTFDAMTLSARGKKHYKATTNFAGNAKELARMLALADRLELFDGDADSCVQMLAIMDKTIPNVTTSFNRDAIRHTPPGVGARRPPPPGLPLLTIDKVASKIGVGVVLPKAKSDCAVIERTTGAETLRYVIVIVGGIFPVGGPVFDANSTYSRLAQLLDAAIHRRH